MSSVLPTPSAGFLEAAAGGPLGVAREEGGGSFSGVVTASSEVPLNIARLRARLESTLRWTRGLEIVFALAGLACATLACQEVYENCRVERMATTERLKVGSTAFTLLLLLLVWGRHAGMALLAIWAQAGTTVPYRYVGSDLFKQMVTETVLCAVHCPVSLYGSLVVTTYDTGTLVYSYDDIACIFMLVRIYLIAAFTLQFFALKTQGQSISTLNNLKPSMSFTARRLISAKPLTSTTSYMAITAIATAYAIMILERPRYQAFATQDNKFFRVLVNAQPLTDFFFSCTPRRPGGFLSPIEVSMSTCPTWARAGDMCVSLCPASFVVSTPDASAEGCPSAVFEDMPPPDWYAANVLDAVNWVCRVEKVARSKDQPFIWPEDFDSLWPMPGTMGSPDILDSVMMPNPGRPGFQCAVVRSDPEQTSAMVDFRHFGVAIWNVMVVCMEIHKEGCVGGWG